ncbi:MAG: hypothetical protein H0U92_03245 [Actinobacteria bacterium]|nr:hypothetical protein [Actinomycetota bacterium]
MTIAAPTPSRRVERRANALRRVGPVTYLVASLVVAVLFLPSALRPPPEQTNDSSALNPNARADQQGEILQSVRQASGGGAGAAQGGEGVAPVETTTTTTPPAAGPDAKGRCFGNPRRQTQSVYSAPCAAAFSGNNGGATGHNVFPNEVRLGLWHSVGAPSAGRVADAPPAGGSETAVNRTFRVLMAHFNQRYQTYGRHVALYGLSGKDTIQDQQAEAVKADTDGIFGAYYLWQGFCEEFVRRGNVMMCNPLGHEVYTNPKNRPGMFSFMMDRTQAMGYGAEWVCKRLLGRNAKYAGAALKGDPRQIGIIAERHAKGGIAPSVFTNLLKQECGGTLVDAVELDAEQAPDQAAKAIAKFSSEGITTIIMETVLYNTLYLMNQAEALNYQPEWVQFSANGLDFNVIGRTFPPNQAIHTFGLSAWEIPRLYPESECYQAYRSIDPANEPDGGACGNFWHPLVMLMNGIQEAGPKLNQASFDAALSRLGRRYPPEPWAIGGGYGPDDYTYMDNISELWWDPNAAPPEGKGAYRWTRGGARYKRGEFDGDDSQLFTKGVVNPGGPES